MGIQLFMSRLSVLLTFFQSLVFISGHVDAHPPVFLEKVHGWIDKLNGQIGRLLNGRVTSKVAGKENIKKSP